VDDTVDVDDTDDVDVDVSVGAASNDVGVSSL
jgi:hypothetical protein